MSSKERRKKGVLTFSSGEKSNSLDWDSPSTKTGTVKRRPNSGHKFVKRMTRNWKTNQGKPKNLARNGSLAPKSLRILSQSRKQCFITTKNWISKFPQRRKAKHPATTMNSLALKNQISQKLTTQRYSTTTRNSNLR
ncbi:unnamed protein product [Acanthoscelides obtectus]|uniref:Uncharacterized protein n=1 Tax=Acanthoscelides obtectus TaxID=200917 RepID=A0A9P0PCB3_ACAOB|nr:unnamed protein product [Acanthoscelides obtectus]CAK1637735.1 hypothetical protein AOBTE_LOCUS10164 [Acanthoscelides obtectus]